MEQIETNVAGTVLSLDVAVGDQVAVDDVVATIESMKMELPVESGYAGTVVRIGVAVGDEVDEGAVLIELSV